VTSRPGFSDAEADRIRAFLNPALYEAGLYCRADDRGDVVLQLAPPLTCGPPEFELIEAILRDVLIRAADRVSRRLLWPPQRSHRVERRPRSTRWESVSWAEDVCWEPATSA
jgi:hypothetical protein